MNIATLLVLLVDKLQEDRETYRNYLLKDKHYSYNILEASTGKKALNLCYQRLPDAIVLSDNLPDMDIMGFLYNFKTQFTRKNISVIVLASQEDEQLAVRAIESGATDCFVKREITPITLRIAIKKNLLQKNRFIEMEEHFSTLVENSPDVIFRLDSNLRHIYISTRVQQEYGIPKEEFLGKTGRELGLPAGACDLFEAACYKALASGEITRVEYNIFGKQYITRLIPERGQDGVVISLMGITEDISERKAAEIALQQKNELLQTIFDHVPVMLVMFDANGQFKWANKEWETVLGWRASDIEGRDMLAEFYPDPDYRQYVLNFVATASRQWSDFKPRTRDGKFIDTMWANVRLSDGSIIGIGQDITEKKQLEAQFYRAQRLESLGTLASGVSHDLNNILAPILAVAQLLQIKLGNLDEKNKEFLKIIEDNSKRAAELVKQITSFARGEEGKRVNLQLGILLQEIEQIVKSTFPKSIKIRTHYATPNLWTIRAEPTQIHQVLMNLCLNARDAMPDGGILSISAENIYVDENYARMNLEAKIGDYTVITVSDTGFGMSKEVLERIFEPFFTTKEINQRTGLGLSRVIGIIKNHDGFINVQSEVAKGSQFQVFLPAVRYTEVAQQAFDSQIVRGNGELILVVDDEASVGDTINSSLLNYNYKILTADDGVEAFSIYNLHKNEISLALVDIQMPSLDGLSTIRILQEINPTVKIIAMTGLSSNLKLLDVNGISVQSFLLKPYTINELLNTIKDVLTKMP